MSAAPREKGYLAIVAAVILVVLAAMGAAMFAMVTSGTRGAGDHARSAKALFLAESGIEWAAKELFAADDPQTDCEGLAGSGPFSLPSGQFSIIDSVYDTADENCDVTSRGTVGTVIRTVFGTIPKSIIEGGGNDLFGNSDEKFNNCNQTNLECHDGTMVFKRPSGGGPGGGNTNTSAQGGDLINDSWEITETVYFTANFGWDADPSGDVFEIELKGPNLACQVILPWLTSGCAAPSGHPLYDQYDVVLVMGTGFTDEDINRVNLSVDWASNPSNRVGVSDGCIGREEFCSGAGSDPVDDGTWNENP